jgi:hypothetical protein
VLDETKGPYLFSSDDLAKMVEVTTSIRTKIAIIGQVGPRLVDPKAKPAYFAGLFRYAEEKSQVEEILKARTQVLASTMFSKTDGIKNMSGRHLHPAGRGSPGRGAGAGRGGGPGSRASSNTSIESGASSVKEHGTPIHQTAINVLRILSDEHEETLQPTHDGFDDVLSALDDLTQKKTIPILAAKRLNNDALSATPDKRDKKLGPIEEGEASENSSSYSITGDGAGRTTNDSSSVDSAHPSPSDSNKSSAANQPPTSSSKQQSKPQKQLLSSSTDENGKVILNKVDSSNTIVTRAPRIALDDQSSATVKDNDAGDISSLSSVDSRSRSNSRPSSKRISAKSQSYMGSFTSPDKPKDSKQITADAPFQSIKTITKKYTDSAVKSSSKDDQQPQNDTNGHVSHDAIAGASATTISERTKAFSNPLLSKKAATPAPATTSSKVGKVLASYPFSPSNSAKASSSSSTSSNSSSSSANGVTKVGKLNAAGLYPFANNSPKSSPTNSSSSFKPVKSPTAAVNKLPARQQPTVTTKVTSYISSSRSLASNSSDNDSLASNNSSKSTGRCSTPSLSRVHSFHPSSIYQKQQEQQQAAAASSSAGIAAATNGVAVLPVLSNYIPEKAITGGSGNFNYDLATRCAMAVKMTKEEFLELKECEPIRVIDGFEKHTYCELVRRNFVKIYGNLNQGELEKYLIAEDFPEVFQKTQVRNASF